MKLIIMILTFIPTIAFSLENCVIYPVEGQVEGFKGKITEISPEHSFANCPDSLLVNENFIFRLVRLANHNDKQMCVYKHPLNGIVFMCEK